MSYSPLLDALFSKWYLNLGLLCVLGGIAYFIYVKFLSQKRWRWVYGAASLGLAFLWLMVTFLWNAEYLGYGYPDGIDGMVLARDRLYVVDYMLAGGSEGVDPTPFSRVHVLKAANGEEILRFPVGDHAVLMGVQGDSLILDCYNETKIFSAETGSCLVTWNSETLPEAFPELAVGIDNIAISREDKVLEITSLDGNHWVMGLGSSKLSPADPARRYADGFTPSKVRYIANSDEIRVGDQPGGRRVLHLDGIGFMQEIAYLKDSQDSILNRELNFIHGKMIAVNEAQGCIVILSFETTKQTGFILTGVSLDGRKRLWELTERGLRPEENLARELTYSWAADDAAGVLYLGIQDEVMALREATGEVVWRRGL